MLSPEIWNFEPPGHHFYETTGTKASKCKIEIANHHFNHSVTVVLPDTVLVPEDLNTALTNDSAYYKVNNLPIHTFVDKQFIDSFIKSGQLTALSVGTHIDTEDCGAVTPSGHLVLNLLKETYQSLGLEGTQSKYSTERYVVQIDLKNPSFTPGKKNYERAVRCLSEFVLLQMDFIIAWEPLEPGEGDQLICPSSVAAYLSSNGYEVHTCDPRTKTSRQYGVRLPSFTETDHRELLEWLGAVALGVDMTLDDEESQYLSSYQGPLEATRETQVAVLNFEGFFTTNRIEQLFSTFSSYVEKRKDMPWAALHVQGFADSPVSWNLQEHTFHSDGDNHYTIVLRPDRTFRLVKSCTSSSKLKFKLS